MSWRQRADAVQRDRSRSASCRRPTAPPRSCRAVIAARHDDGRRRSGARRVPSRESNAHRIDRPVVGHERDDRLAVVAETRRRDAAIEILGRLHALRRAACRRRRRAPDAPCRRRRTSSRRPRGTRSTCRRGSTPACQRPPRLVAGVSAFSVDPGFASATNNWLDGSRSGSSWRLLVNAMRVPSGDHDGDDSSALPVVSRSSFLVAMSNR